MTTVWGKRQSGTREESPAPLGRSQGAEGVEAADCHLVVGWHDGERGGADARTRTRDEGGHNHLANGDACELQAGARRESARNAQARDQSNINRITASGLSPGETQAAGQHISSDRQRVALA